MFTPNKATGIETMAYELIEKLKRYSESQRESWHRVPYLALQADGRMGYNEQYSRAYKNGFWAIDLNPANGYHAICVDLESGRLVDPNNPANPPNDKDLLVLALNSDKINANKIIAELERKSKAPVRRGYNNPGHQSWIQEWRERILREFNLIPERYSRTAS